MGKKTKRERKLNRRKNIVYSSYYSVVSFTVSFSYLIADIFIDGKIATILAAVLLAVLIATCEFGIKKLHKELEANNPKAKKWQEHLSKIAMEVSYLSYPLMVATLLLAIAANL